MGERKYDQEIDVQASKILAGLRELADLLEEPETGEALDLAKNARTTIRCHLMDIIAMMIVTVDANTASIAVQLVTISLLLPTHSKTLFMTRPRQLLEISLSTSKYLTLNYNCRKAAVVGYS
jgi:hypothetical protein